MRPHEVPFLIHLLLLLLLSEQAACECTAGTCLNNGTCVKSYIGKGFKCNCPMLGQADYGPRCELAVRGYATSLWGAAPKYVTTRHDLSGHQFEPDSLMITLEFSGHCWVPPCKIFVINGQNSKPLVTVELQQNFGHQINLIDQEDFHVWSPAHDDHNDKINSRIHLTSRNYPTMKADDWNQHWQSMSIHMSKDKTGLLEIRVQLCSLKLLVCIEEKNFQAYTGDLASKFANSSLSVGKLSGCIRFIRLNGVLVDLGPVSGFEGTQLSEYTFPYCSFFKHSCMKLSSTVLEKNYCGSDSQCDGQIRRMNVTSQDTCTCRCVNAKRRQRETIADSDKCTMGPLPSNECNIDTPILLTMSDNYDVKWTTNHAGPISGGFRFFSMEAFVKTREINVKEMLALTNGNETLPYIKISRGLLDVCIGASCYPFPKVPVSDGKWHSVSVTIQKAELTAMLDMVTTVHTVKLAFKFTGANLTLSIPNSCVRAVRLSNIYMPTGDTDVTADNDTMFIKVLKGSGVSAVQRCNTVMLPQPDVCKCREFEDCDTSSGEAKCSCKKGFVSGQDGKCAINPDLLQKDPSTGDEVRPGCTTIIISFMLLLLGLIG